MAAPAGTAPVWSAGPRWSRTLAAGKRRCWTPALLRSARTDRMAQVDRRGVTATRGPGGHAIERTVNLGRGLVVPYPEPASAAATNIGKANRRTNTKPEVLVRSALHRRGLRFRKDHLLRVADVRVRPDVVFTRWKLAVFIDGCF